jgi:hypothetical protein
MSRLNEHVIAAFFMEGLRELDYQKVLDTWGCGCLELVYEMCQYAPLTEQLLQAAGEKDFLGIFDYEVSAPFGEWFGKYILSTGGAPDKRAASVWLVTETYNFFTQTRQSEDSTALLNRLYRVQDQFLNPNVRASENAT